MAGRQFGGGLSYRTGEESDVEAGKEIGSAAEGDESPVASSPGHSLSRTPVSFRKRPGEQKGEGGSKTKRLRTPPTVPIVGRQALKRKLDEVLENQQEILKGMANLQQMFADFQQRTLGTKQRENQRKVQVPNDVRPKYSTARQKSSKIASRHKLTAILDIVGNVRYRRRERSVAFPVIIGELSVALRTNSAANNDTTQAVMEYVQGLLPGYGDKLDVIKAAVDTYFDSKRREEKRQAEGKAEKHRKRCTRNTRIAKKLEHRKKALRAKTSYTKADKKKLERVLVTEYMSSEESGSDGEGGKVFKTRSIPWQSDLFTKYKV
ncbi:hypothetical protein Bbelb_040180 [Branchiostoma belcheri]|nr:hypothetical protein Bbelb_040180 [Branchiostoma belcheri]